MNTHLPFAVRQACTESRSFLRQAQDERTRMAQDECLSEFDVRGTQADFEAENELSFRSVEIVGLVDINIAVVVNSFQFPLGEVDRTEEIVVGLEADADVGGKDDFNRAQSDFDLGFGAIVKLTGEIETEITDTTFKIEAIKARVTEILHLQITGPC